MTKQGESADLRQWRVRAVPASQSPPAWAWSELSGRLTEISGRGAVAPLTAAIRLVHQAQLDGELVGWIALAAGTFFPPDVADSGVDLDSLAVVRVASAREAARAADKLVRSGAFGLVVLDLGTDDHIPIPLQGRLIGLAQRHDAAIVCLTEKEAPAPSIGSMVSLRVQALRVAGRGERFDCRIQVIKDKRHGPGWSHTEQVRGPAGLR
jgi:recombination protein RecA